MLFMSRGYIYGFQRLRWDISNKEAVGCSTRGQNKIQI